MSNLIDNIEIRIEFYFIIFCVNSKKYLKLFLYLLRCLLKLIMIDFVLSKLYKLLCLNSALWLINISSIKIMRFNYLWKIKKKAILILKNSQNVPKNRGSSFQSDRKFTIRVSTWITWRPECVEMLSKYGKLGPFRN